MDRLPKRSLHDRFWSKVNKTDSCWLWTGATNGHGYGQITLMANKHKVSPYTHRMAYEWLVGAVGKDLDLDHLCRVPACCNPAHLEPVTHQVNMSRSKAATKMACKLGHDWTNPKNVYIRHTGVRWCAECARTRWTKRRTHAIQDPV